MSEKPWICDSCLDGGLPQHCVRPEACFAVLEGRIIAADCREGA